MIRTEAEVDLMSEAQKKMHQMMGKPPTPQQLIRRKVGVNDPCPCGSGKKFKKCCKLEEREVW
jgi:uncharacterized protein